SPGMTTVDRTVSGFAFRATLEPDGQRSHWLRVNRKMREAAGADAGDVVTLEIAPAGGEPEPRVPADLRKALAAAPKARALWSDITPIARRDWIHWIASAKRPETRARRVDNACAMLAAGKRRVCCFDRSGFYSKSFNSPKAAIRGVFLSDLSQQTGLVCCRSSDCRSLPGSNRCVPGTLPKVPNQCSPCQFGRLLRSIDRETPRGTTHGGRRRRWRCSGTAIRKWPNCTMTEGACAWSSRPKRQRLR